MPHLLLKHLPRYECLLEAAQQFPALDPSAFEAYLHLLRAGDDALTLVNEHLSTFEISHGRFTVLMLLLQHCSCPKNEEFVTPADLADMAGCTRATMTGLIDTLERDGFVKREPDARDRRMMAVKLTAKGRGMLNKILPGHFSRMATMMSGLSETERKTLVRLLSKISEKTAAAAASAAIPHAARQS
jgi:DNA-binding MarR family transcriptional regulator